MTDTDTLLHAEPYNLDWASCMLHQDPSRGRLPLDHENRVKALSHEAYDLSNTGNWLDIKGVKHHDLKGIRGNGPFGSHGSFLGVALHVNVSGPPGTGIGFWGAGTSVNPASVCPNFEVYTNGHIIQLLPFDWQPWCQEDGNYQYAAIETGGMPGKPFTKRQAESISRILRAYHHRMGMELHVIDHPGHRGVGTHQMGGESWGGHPCPGTIRAKERHALLETVRKYDKEHHLS